MTFPYEPEPLPPEEAPVLSETLEREHGRVQASINARLDLDATRLEEVTKPQEGWLRYFDATVYDPGEGTGLYLYSGGKWRRYATGANIYTYLTGKAFMGWWSPNGGLDAGRSFNMFSITTPSAGIYRFTVNQNTILGEDLLAVTVPMFAVYPVNKTDEGFVITTTQAGGTDGSNRSYFDLRLDEAYIQGNSLRQRLYTLTGDEAISGVGFANFTPSNADPLPP